MEPTIEQQAVIDAALTRENLVVQAGAGTGKTSTLQLVSEQLQESSLYIAYNKPIATDAAARFLPYVKCKTSHSLAFGAVGRNFAPRLNGGRKPPWEVATDLELPGWIRVGTDTTVSVNQQVRIAADTVKRFCYSADDEIDKTHVPFQNGIKSKAHDDLVTAMLPVARKWWDDVNNPRGILPFEHDHYLKMWALTKPRLDVDVIYLDEAQDSNPLLAKLVQDQTHTQQIVVGDSCQQMYAWRGAVDALSDWGDSGVLYLSQSWRFGQAIADEANKWLSQLPTPLRLVGNPVIDSYLDTLSSPRAVLCRTNAGALNEIFGLLDNGLAVALVGGGQQLAKLAKAAADLRNGKRTTHPDLFAFETWDDVVDYAYEGGADLLPLVNLINAHGTEKIIAATNSLTSDESRADVVVSTTHKSKGREWDTVKVSNDFFAPSAAEGGKATISDGEAMVGYVAVTRAKEVLDRNGVAWIDSLALVGGGGDES